MMPRAGLHVSGRRALPRPSSFPRHVRLLLGAALVVALAPTALPASAQGTAPANPTQRVRGTVARLDGSSLVVKSREGEDVTIRLADNWVITGIVKASLADIKPGTFIGTAALPKPDGSLTALEVLIFPEAMRGTGEGSRPYDLRPNSTMTNATVADSVVGNDGHTLMIKYKDGEKKVVVSPETPVVTYVPADKSDLKPGAKVIAFKKKLPDGSFETNRVNVGRDGLTPPM